MPHTPQAVRDLIHRFGPARRITACYEAGPCGYGLYRQLSHQGVRCLVVAPSLVPAKPGERVKTDRRDAIKLARLLRSRELTAVWVPDAPHEALRDLTRAREDARYDVVRARHRLSKLLLRLGVLPPPGLTAWTTRHQKWLDSVALPLPAQQVVLDEYRLDVFQHEERIRRLEAELGETAAASPQAALITALRRWWLNSVTSPAFAHPGR